jgi:CheY-like chemotaxis protein
LKTPLQAFCFSTSELVSSLLEIKKVCIDNYEGHLSDECSTPLILSAIEAAQNLMTYSEFMNMSINQSLDFSKSTHGICLSPTFNSVNLDDAIKYPVECIRAIHFRMSIVVEMDVPKTDYIITDGHWLKDNLICLLSNAVKNSVDGDVCLRCTITTNLNNVGLPEKFVKFEVEDHGIGVTEVQRENLLKPFPRIHNKAGGTGLGLYSLSKRTQALGGTFGIEDRIDGTHGSLVWFTFPYKQDFVRNQTTAPPSAVGSFEHFESDNVRMQSAEEIIRINPNPGSGDVKQVLIVDDSPIIVKMLKRSLEAASYAVVVAENGAEACASYEKHEGKFDAIVTDIQMPVRGGSIHHKRLFINQRRYSVIVVTYKVMDGIEFAARIRQREAQCPTKSRTPVIGMSANSDGSIRDQVHAIMSNF